MDRTELNYNIKTALLEAALTVAQEISNAADDLGFLVEQAVKERDTDTICNLLDDFTKSLLAMNEAFDKLLEEAGK